MPVRLVPFVLIAACAAPPADHTPADAPSGTVAIEASAQRRGDPDAGWDFVRYGEFVGSGVPFERFVELLGEDDDNLLDREGDSARLAPWANAFDAPNGVRVAGGTTCMGCHAGFLGDGFYPGMGNTELDFTPSVGFIFDLLGEMIAEDYGADSPEAAITEVYLRGARATQDQIRTGFRGVNPAMRLAVAAAAHRDPETLAWHDEASYAVLPTDLASDVPALWNVGKKNALYYNGMGRGDFARLVMQISVVAVVDQEQAEAIDARMPDLLAWIDALEAPAFPGPIDAERALEGLAVFQARCEACHGTYGADETYPNLLVDADVVGTDPEYARYFLDQDDYAEWFNRSWFTELGTYAEPTLAYMAPPLDGVWATAPYFHNASVPTLAGVLDSEARPTRWRRDYRDRTYDLEAVGWPVEATDDTAVDVYDTTAFGYGNGGHTFADDLDAPAREALLEYLKTL